MYYRHRLLETTMAAQATNPQACLVHRVTGYPMVAAGMDQVVGWYSWGKQVHPLIDRTLSIGEAAAVGAYTVAEPVVLHRLDTPIRMASSVAVRGLDTLETRFPAIKKTPDEVWDDSMSYYDESRVKAGVDRVLAARDYTVDKVYSTKSACVSRVGSVVDGGHSTAVNTVKASMVTLNTLLDAVNDLVDRHLASTGAARAAGNPMSRGPQTSGDQASLDSAYERMKEISAKAYLGVKSRTTGQYLSARDYTLHQLESIKTAMILLDYVKSQQTWAAESMGTAQEQMAGAYKNLTDKAAMYGKQPDVLLLDSSRQLAAALNVFARRLATLTDHRLPAVAAQSVQRTVEATQALTDRLQETSSLSDLKEDTLSLLRDQVNTVRGGFAFVLDQLAGYVPTEWVPNFLGPPSSAPSNGEQNGFIPTASTPPTPIISHISSLSQSQTTTTTVLPNGWTKPITPGTPALSLTNQQRVRREERISEEEEEPEDSTSVGDQEDQEESGESYSDTSSEMAAVGHQGTPATNPQ